MSMEMTWLEFQLSTDNQKGLFSYETENETTAAILVLSILINRSYFQVNALKPGIYRLLGVCESIGIVRWNHVRSNGITW